MNKATKSLIVILVILLLAIASRVSVDKETILEGKWVSDKDLTIENINLKETLSPEKMEFMENNLGKMAHIYNGSKLTLVLEHGEADMFFRISDVSEGKISIETYEYMKLGSLYLKLEPINSHEFERIGKCIVVESWYLNEYFCK